MAAGGCNVVPCYTPIEAWQLVSGDIVFRERGDIHRSLKLACGNCIGCRLSRSRSWAIRCMHEASLHERSCFVTLTYDDVHCPSQNSLNYADFQAFMRRLRKRSGLRCFDVTTWQWVPRFYMCGEYGELTKRPHFHACLFGIDFDDKKYFRKLPSGSRIYTSEILQSLWPFGYSSIGDVTFESAAYIARYICKKVTGADAFEHYARIDPETGEVYSIRPEFTRMSLKPGIGYEWYRKYSGDVFPHDRVVVRGKECNVPKYYKLLLKERDPFACDDLDFDRVKKAEAFVDDCSEARLAVREVVTRARLAFKVRKLEH